MKMDQTDQELEIQRLYQLACSHQPADPRAAIVCAKQILKLEVSHPGAWNLIYHRLGNAEPAGTFEGSFIEYNFAHLREWYQRRRTEKYIRGEQAKLQAQLAAWRKSFDEQNRTGLADRAPVLIMLLLGIVAAVGFGLIVFDNGQKDWFDSLAWEGITIIGGMFLLAFILIFVGVIARRRFTARQTSPRLAPQAPADVRWQAIETHFQHMRADLETQRDQPATIPPAFALFINPDLSLCPTCGRVAGGHQCAPMPIQRSVR